MKSLRHLIALALLTLSIAGWAGDVHWIDVRSAEEYAGGHVEGALNIPHDRIGEQIAALELEPDATIYLYCRSGRRSGIAKDTLESLGYTAVTNAGGLEDALKMTHLPAEN